MAGVVVLLYPTVSAWLVQYNQSQIIRDADGVVAAGPNSLLQEELGRAREYNSQLSGGAVVEAGQNVPTGTVTEDSDLDYWDLLLSSDEGVMGRLRIPSIDVELPIYHGTAEETLAKGVGHLEGTSLPIGGSSQHSVLTAHRGLPEATLFDNLGQVELGDTFTIEIFGEVLTYRAVDTQTVLPEETQALNMQYDRDLVTLVTCTPLGINTHRYLVTGERVYPTPASDLERAGQPPNVPGFPWWALALGGSLVAYAVFVAVSGRATAKNPPKNPSQ